MIKNSNRRTTRALSKVAPSWLAPVTLLLLFSTPACQQRASVPEGLQGVLAYDQRVLGFEQAGRVIEVPVHRGQMVHAGDVVARLDDALARDSLDARKAELEIARAELALLEAGSRQEDIASAASDVTAASVNEALLKRTANRERTLLADGAIPAAEEDKATADFVAASARRASLSSRLTALRRGPRPQEIARARANFQSRSSAVAQESERLARYVLRAEVAGMVLDVLVKAGEVATSGSPAIVLADVEHPYADVFVPEGRAGAMQVGAVAEARVDASAKSFPAAIEYLSPAAEFTPKFIFSDSERPYLVLRARARIEDSEHALHSGVPVFVRVAP